MNIEKDIQDFLDSGMLEQYVIGATTDAQNKEVEHRLENSAELRFAYEKLQEELLAISSLYSKEPPAHLKDDILQGLPSVKTIELPKKSNWNWLNIAAVCIALISIAGFIYTGSQKKDLENQLSESSRELDKVRSDAAYASAAKNVLQAELAFIKDAATSKYFLKGNQKALGLLAAAYYNKEDDQGVLELLNVPQLDEQHDYQLWADVDGEMISLAVLNDDFNNVLDPEILKNAASLNITIEPAGGNDHATVDNLVAAVRLDAQP